MIMDTRQCTDGLYMLRIKGFRDTGSTLVDVTPGNAKDIIIREDIGTPHLSELRPGLGKLDYNVFLKELSKLKNVPLMIEHLQTAEEYCLAADYIRSVAKKNNINC